ncbi:MAG: hypothetical protein F4Z21_07090 [Acidobacteria bacterium]|nr:hypothetical protein [Acidobacteriota bacterium]
MIVPNAIEFLRQRSAPIPEDGKSIGSLRVAFQRTDSSRDGSRKPLDGKALGTEVGVPARTPAWRRRHFLFHRLASGRERRVAFRQR